MESYSFTEAKGHLQPFDSHVLVLHQMAIAAGLQGFSCFLKLWSSQVDFADLHHITLHLKLRIDEKGLQVSLAGQLGMARDVSILQDATSPHAT